MDRPKDRKDRQSLMDRKKTVVFSYGGDQVWTERMGRLFEWCGCGWRDRAAVSEEARPRGTALQFCTSTSRCVSHVARCGEDA